MQADRSALARRWLPRAFQRNQASWQKTRPEPSRRTGNQAAENVVPKAGPPGVTRGLPTAAIAAHSSSVAAAPSKEHRRKSTIWRAQPPAVWRRPSLWPFQPTLSGLRSAGSSQLRLRMAASKLANSLQAGLNPNNLDNPASARLS